MGCGCSMPLGESLNTYEGPVPSGVPNPFTPMLHSYPTRYHGPIYTRPMNAFPWRERPYDFALEEGMQGLGSEPDDKAIPPAWKWVIALGLSAGVVWAVVHWSNAQAAGAR
jgi:hypothetical protein